MSRTPEITTEPGRNRMHRARRPRLLALALGVLLPLLGTLLSAPPAQAQAEAGSVVYLVRHAEKAERPSDDPPLTPAGERRARALARVLSDAGITRVHTTDTERTRATAIPTARTLGLDVEIYDGRDLEAIARTVRDEPGRHLVVGHSNTTPELVTLLGGDPGRPIAEAWEYDRLYVLVLGGQEEDRRTRTLLLRFGPLSAP